MASPPLVATVALWVAWFFLPAFSVDFFLVSRSFTFWQLLGLNEAALSNPGATTHGLFAMIGLAAIAAPFAAPFLHHPRATLLHAAPLTYVVAALFGRWWKWRSAMASAGGDSEIARGMTREVASAAWEAVSIGIGAYVLLAAAAFLTYYAVHASRRAASRA